MDYLVYEWFDKLINYLFSHGWYGIVMKSACDARYNVIRYIINQILPNK